MTEDDKEVYQKGVAYLEEWEDVNYCEHSFKFKDEWLTDKEVVDLLNALHEENQQLKQECKPLFTKKQLHQENQRIKQTIREMMETERTQIGKNTLRELWDRIQ